MSIRKTSNLTLPFVLGLVALFSGCATNSGLYKTEASVENRLLTMSRDDVLADLGPPDKKIALSEKQESWKYDSQVSGLTGGDCSLTLIIEGGKVVKATLNANDLSWVSFPLGSCRKILQTLRGPTAPASPPSLSPAPTPAAVGDQTLAMKTIRSDVDKPEYTTPENPNNFAVIVGVEKYASLPVAEFAERDAEAVRAHLMAMGYPARNIYFLSGPQATRAKISQSVNTWLPNRVGDTSTVFFYYAGHGAPDPKTNLAYLVPVDGDAEDLDSTAYPIKQLYAKLGNLNSRHVIVALDSCFSGAGGRSVLSKGTRPLVNSIDLGGLPDNVIALTASDKSEISGTIEDQGHGAFTYYMLRGLAGAAKNASGTVTVQSLYDYLTPKVEDAARLHNRDQTPQLLHADTNVAVSQTQLR